MNIIIATNNGKKFLIPLLESIERHGGIFNHRVSIVDTGSTDAESIAYLDELKRNEKYSVNITPYKGYDTGAYIWAYKNFQDDEFLFMHDSMEVAEEGWLQDFGHPPNAVKAYASFGMTFDYGTDQQQRLIDLGIYNPDSATGIMGPIFCVPRTVLDSLDQRFDLKRLIPQKKTDQQGMERGWAMLFDTMRVPVSFVTYIKAGNPHTVNDCNPKLRKIIIERR